MVALKQAASKALEAGDFAQGETLLNEASHKDLEGAQRFQQMATKRWLSAAASQAELGALKETQLRYAEAATSYRRAVELAESIPKSSEAILAAYLNNMAAALLRAGDYASAEPSFQRAMAVLEQVLGPDHPQVAPCLGNYAMLFRATNRIPEADELEIRAKTIRAKYAPK